MYQTREEKIKLVNVLPKLRGVEDSAPYTNRDRFADSDKRAAKNVLTNLLKIRDVAHA